MTLSPVSDRLRTHAREWDVTVESVRETETSLIGFGARGAEQVVLKVARQPAEEWRAGALMAAFGGNGLVRPLDYADGAVLLQRLKPGHDLSEYPLARKDDEATHIIAGIIGQMSSVTSPSFQGVPVGNLADDFQTCRENGCDFVSPAIIERAEHLFLELSKTQQQPRVLHGDLHHYNVLFDRRQGWVAIDPWGPEAEIEYEVGASLRNPIDAPDLLARTETYVARLRIHERCLGFNADRALRWAFAQAVLAALWCPTEGLGVDMRLPFATAAKAMLPLL